MSTTRSVWVTRALAGNFQSGVAQEHVRKMYDPLNSTFKNLFLVKWGVNKLCLSWLFQIGTDIKTQSWKIWRQDSDNEYCDVFAAVYAERETKIMENRDKYAMV